MATPPKHRDAPLERYRQPVRDKHGIEYTSWASLALGRLLFCWPLKVIHEWQHNHQQALIEQIVNDPPPRTPIGVSRILRGAPQTTSLFDTLKSLGETK